MSDKIDQLDPVPFITDADLQDAQQELDQERIARATAWELAKREVACAREALRELVWRHPSDRLVHRAIGLLDALDHLDRLEKEGC